MFCKNIFHRFIHGDGGATAIEYALIATGIAVAAASTIFILGDTVNLEFYEPIRDAL